MHSRSLSQATKSCKTPGLTANAVFAHALVISMEFGSLVRKLIVHIDNDLEKEMSAYPEVDWTAVVLKAIRNCISARENYRFYETIVERAILEDRKRQSKTSRKKVQESLSSHRRRVCYRKS